LRQHPSKKIPPARRTALFRVAAAEFAAHGYRQASLNRIILAVGMSKSSFYHYFKNKSDLFQQTLAQPLAPIIALGTGFDFQTLDAQSFWPFFEGLIAAASQLADTQPELVDVGHMFYRALEQPEGQNLTGGILDLATEWATGLLCRGQDLGLLRKDLPQSLLIDSVMAMAMALDRWFLKNWDTITGTDRQALGARTFDLFRRLLEKRPDQPPDAPPFTIAGSPDKP